MENKKPLIFFGNYDDVFNGLLSFAKEHLNLDEIEIIRFTRIPQVNLKIQNDSQCMIVSNDLVNLLEVLKTNIKINKSNNNKIILLQKDPLSPVAKKKLENAGVSQVLTDIENHQASLEEIKRLLIQLKSVNSNGDQEETSDKIIIKNIKEETIKSRKSTGANVLKNYMKGDVNEQKEKPPTYGYAEEKKKQHSHEGVPEHISTNTLGTNTTETIHTNTIQAISKTGHEQDSAQSLDASSSSASKKKALKSTQVFHAYKNILNQFQGEANNKSLPTSSSHYETEGKYLYKKQRSKNPFLPQTKVFEVLIQLSTIYQQKVFSKNIFLNQFASEISSLFKGELILLEVKNGSLVDSFMSPNLNSFEMKNKWLFLKDKMYSSWLKVTTDTWCPANEEFEYQYLCSPLYFNDKVKALAFITLPGQVSHEDKLLIELFAATLGGLYSNVGSTEIAVSKRSLIIRMLYRIINFFRKLFNKEMIA